MARIKQSIYATVYVALILVVYQLVDFFLIIFQKNRNRATQASMGEAKREGRGLTSPHPMLLLFAFFTLSPFSRSSLVQ